MKNNWRNIISILIVASLWAIYGCENENTNLDAGFENASKKRAETIKRMKSNGTWKSCEDVSDRTDCMKALEWMQENNIWGAEGLIVKYFRIDLENAINIDNGNVQCKMGWGLSKSGSAYKLGLKAGKFYVTELSKAEAVKEGITEMNFSSTHELMVSPKKEN